MYNLSFLILIGLILGIFCGLFFGEFTAIFTPVADAYLMLLRMSVIPYIAFALIHGIGKLSVEEALRLLKKGWPFFLLIWGITLAIVYALQYLLPHNFSDQLSPSAAKVDAFPIDFLNIFIPTNPFKALATDAIPAVVVFCLFFGASLIKVVNKNALLTPLEIVIEGLNKVTTWVSYLGPIGVFALMASSAGTINLVDFDKMHHYLFAVILGCLFLSLWLFPILISTFTNVSYRQLLKELPTTFLLSFTAASPLVAFPYLLKAVRNIANEHGIDPKDSQKTCEAIVPIGINFPTAGNFFAILFIIFIAFYYGQSLDLYAYLQLNSLSFVLLFGPSAQISSAISFLMDLLDIPADGLAIYAKSMPISRYFVALASISGVASLTLLIVFSYSQKLEFKPRMAIYRVALSACVLVGFIFLGRSFDFSPKNISPSYSLMKLTAMTPVSVNLTNVLPPDTPSISTHLSEDALSRIQKTKTLRVGYYPASMPFAYFNGVRELVGYDIAVAYHLAYELNAELDLVPFRWEDLTKDLEADLFDIAMTGVMITEERLQELCFSTPYMDGSFVLVVPNYKQGLYGTNANLNRRKGLKIAIYNGTALMSVAPILFPNAEIVPIDTEKEFLKSHVADALFWTQQHAQAWVMFHPQYCVVNLSPKLAKTSFGYPMAKHSPKLQQFVNEWLVKNKELLQDEHKKWFGKQIKTSNSRWCIMRDVLHWVP